MKFERVCRFNMNMSGYGVAASGLFMGVYFFLHVLYYFGFGDVSSMDKNTLWVSVILPLGCSGVFFLLLRGFQINVPVLYAVLGLFLCGLMVFTDNAEGASALDVIWLVIALAALFVVFLGYITIRSVASVVFLVPFLLRLKDAFGAFDTVSLDKIIEFMPQAWCLCLLLAMVFLPRGLEREELKKTSE